MRFVDAEHLQAYAAAYLGSRTGLVEAACDVVK